MQPWPSRAAELSDATGDVDRDDRPLPAARHRRDGEVVEHAAVYQELTVPCGHRREDPGDGEARVDRTRHRTGPVHDRLARDQVTAQTEEPHWQFLDPPLTE